MYNTRFGKPFAVEDFRGGKSILRFQKRFAINLGWVVWNKGFFTNSQCQHINSIEKHFSFWEVQNHRTENQKFLNFDSCLPLPDNWWLYLAFSWVEFWGEEEQEDWQTVTVIPVQWMAGTSGMILGSFSRLRCMSGFYYRKKLYHVEEENKVS